jgi:hypothetical protein
MLLLVRNSFGVFSVLVSGSLIVLILWHGSPELQTIAAYALSWFLLLSGVRFVFMDGSGAGDADSLRKLTHIPRGLLPGLPSVGRTSPPSVMGPAGVAVASSRVICVSRLTGCA